LRIISVWASRASTVPGGHGFAAEELVPGGEHALLSAVHGHGGSAQGLNLADGILARKSGKSDGKEY
jgi:hypothetical protein